jgi:hypothetical protein
MTDVIHIGEKNIIYYGTPGDLEIESDGPYDNNASLE